MEEDQKKEKDSDKKPKVTDDGGLKISYHQKELEKFFPKLVSEISEKKKSMKINTVSYEVEPPNDIDTIKECYQEDLKNPGPIDFIRRCTNKEDAIEIIDYLLRRKEISSKTHNSLKLQILKEGGLQKLINESGGLKEPGYYVRKYYHQKNITNSKLDKHKNLD